MLARYLLLIDIVKMRYVPLYNDSLHEQSGLQAPSDLKACLVLGARLRPDNTLTPILQLRARLVSILARTYPQWTFYISGCRADTSVIYRTLVEQYHIAEERLVIDSCGYNTFCSIHNMKAYYGLTRFYVLTSSFHIVRALRVAGWLGLEAWGIDISAYEKVKTNHYYWRERLATVKSLVSVILARMHLDGMTRRLILKGYEWYIKYKVKRADARNGQLMQRMMSNVDETLPPTEYFFVQMLALGARPGYTETMGKERLVVLLDRVDCTTVMENALALALCYINGHTTLEHLKDYYRRMHYLDGVVSYATRNHYFTWIMQSAISEGFVERIGPDEPAFPFTGLVDMRPSYMTTNRHLFRDLGLADDETFSAIMRREQQGVRFTYIPRELLNMPQQSELGVICDGDLLAVVCDQHTWARGLEVKHILMAKWQQGRLFFYHVGAEGKGLSPLDAFTYMKDKLTMIGVAVYRLKYLKD